MPAQLSSGATTGEGVKGGYRVLTAALLLQNVKGLFSTFIQQRDCSNLNPYGARSGFGRAGY